MARGRRSSNSNALGLYDACNSTCPDLESAFSQVTDHYNATINFFPKHAAFRTIDVCKDVKANQARKCCTFEDDRVTDNCEERCATYGFIGFPERAPFQTVQACGKIGCVCKTGKKGSCNESTDSCNCDVCSDPQVTSLGFVNWPPRAYYHNVRACGKVQDNLCKKCKPRPRRRRKHRRRRRRSSVSGSGSLSL